MSESLASKTVTSVAWTYMSFVLSKTSAVIVTIVLTYLIVPEEYGIVGFAITSMSFMDAIRDLGVGLALIQRRKEVEKAANTAFMLTVGSNILMWLFAFAVSPFVADFFHEPEILLILPVISVSFIINGMGATHDALLQREMSFAKRAIPMVSASIVKGVVSVALAFMGFGVWAIVFGLLAGRTVYTQVAWRVMPWRPNYRFSFRTAIELLRYGYKVSIDSFISALQANIDYVFIGRFLGETSLGLYTVAFRVPEMVIINFCTVIAQVLFPAYSSVQNDREQLNRAVFAALRYISIIIVPAGIGLALISPIFVNTFLSEDYEAAGPIMSMLSLYGMFLAVSWNVGDLYKAINRADILWKTAIFEFALLAPVLYVLAQDSVLAVAAGHVAVAFIVSFVRLVIAGQILEVPLTKLLAQFVSSIIGTILMGASVLLVLNVAPADMGFLAMLLAILVGAIVYSASMWWLERELAEMVLDLVKRKVLRRGSSSEDETEAPSDV